MKTLLAPVAILLLPLVILLAAPLALAESALLRRASR